MKLKTTIILAITCIAISAFSNQPQVKKAKVYSIVKQWQSVEWYQAQANLWRAEVEDDQSNQEAWLNLYTAKRMLKNPSGRCKSR